jgi:hypothetical protein
MRGRLPFLAFAAASVTARTGHADEKQVCFDGYVDVQALRHDSKLAAARAAAARCGRSVCPP